MKLKLLDKSREFDDIWSFRFSFDESLLWLAGQSIRLEIPNKNWGYSERRFTIMSLPKDQFIQITTRISNSQFKQNLDKLKLGEEVTAYNIDGQIKWGDAEITKVFIAGGLGINPILMILKDAIKHNVVPMTKLLYSYRGGYPLYKNLLDGISRQHPEISIYYSNKRFDTKDVKDVLDNHKHSDVQVIGPSSMTYEITHFIKSSCKYNSINSILLG